MELVLEARDGCARRVYPLPLPFPDPESTLY